MQIKVNWHTVAHNSNWNTKLFYFSAWKKKFMVSKVICMCAAGCLERVLRDFKKNFFFLFKKKRMIPSYFRIDILAIDTILWPLCSKGLKLAELLLAQGKGRRFYSIEMCGVANPRRAFDGKANEFSERQILFELITKASPTVKMAL